MVGLTSLAKFWGCVPSQKNVRMALSRIFTELATRGKFRRLPRLVCNL
jgi:hypothetical protein